MQAAESSVFQNFLAKERFCIYSVLKDFVAIRQPFFMFCEPEEPAIESYKLINLEQKKIKTKPV